MSTLLITFIAIIIIMGYRDWRVRGYKKKTGNKKCPECSSEIPASALKCPHCRHDFRDSIMRYPALFILLVLFVSWGINGFSVFPTIETPESTTSPVSKQEPPITFTSNEAKQICSQYTSWTISDCNKLANRRVWVGMSYEMLTYLRGKPDHKNVSNYGYGNEYQYCWDDRTPSCFYDDDNDGIIDAYN